MEGTSCGDREVYMRGLYVNTPYIVRLFASVEDVAQPDLEYYLCPIKECNFSFLKDRLLNE
jgi:hypothetical protein